MSQEYIPVTWVDETENQVGTVINKARLDQMQSAHHYADGFEEVDAVPTADPQVDYHKVVFCTADTTFYRWDGTQWVKDVDDSTLALLEAHEADHNNPHVVTKTQVGLGNVDNKASVSSWQTTPDNDHIPTEKLVKDGLDAKLDDSQLKIAWTSPVSDSNIPSEKLVKDSLDTVDSSALHKADAEDVTGVKTFKANVNIGEVGSPKNLTMVGDLTITGNITQNGSSYETHAEQVFTTDDFITMRDGATGGLATGDYSGFKIKKYDGTNDGALVVDNSGTARVGDVGDEQPLLTRDEEADLSDGQVLEWDAADAKAVGVTPATAPASGSSAPITAGGVYTAIHNKNQILTSKSVACTTSRGSDAYSSLVSSTTYPYRGEYTDATITGDEFVSVVFSSADASSGNYAPTCVADTGKIVIFSKTSVTVTVPTIMIERDL